MDGPPATKRTEGAHGKLPSPRAFAALAAVSSLTPLVNSALHEPISRKMNAMLAVAGIAFPAVGLVYLLGKPRGRDKLAVFLAFVFGGLTLLWGRLDRGQWTHSALGLWPVPCSNTGETLRAGLSQGPAGAVSLAIDSGTPRSGKGGFRGLVAHN